MIVICSKTCSKHRGYYMGACYIGKKASNIFRMWWIVKTIANKIIKVGYKINTKLMFHTNRENYFITSMSESLGRYYTDKRTHIDEEVVE
jgi:hypothetical protein